MINASFNEGEDKVEMEVSGGDEFLGDERESSLADATESQRDLSHSENYSNSMEESSSSKESEKEQEQSKENTNENARREEKRAIAFKRKSSRESKDLQDDSSDEEMNPEEFKSMKKFAKFLEKSRFINRQGGGDVEPQQPREHYNHPTKHKRKSGMEDHSIIESSSSTTIYRQALPLNSKAIANTLPQFQNVDEEVSIRKRESSSSEEKLNSSDEMRLEGEEFDTPYVTEPNDKVLFKQFLEYKMWEQKDRERRRSTDDDGIRLSTSRYRSTEERRAEATQDDIKRMVQRAKKTKATMYQIPGKQDIDNVAIELGLTKIFKENDVLMSALVDEDYTTVENHVDETMRQRIISGQYIDLAKLVPKDKVQANKDPRMELVNRGGRAYYELAYDRETSVINSFAKWQQAFRVYASIYSETNPRKIKELLQYEHIIHTASLTYTWDNVYAYDMDFHIHMGKYPQCN